MIISQLMMVINLGLANGHGTAEQRRYEANVFVSLSVCNMLRGEEKCLIDLFNDEYFWS